MVSQQIANLSCVCAVRVRLAATPPQTETWRRWLTRPTANRLFARSSRAVFSTIYTPLAQWNQSSGFLPRVSGVRISQGVPKRKERSMISFGLCDSTRIRGKPNTYTPLAQRNRALRYGRRCRGFKSLKACQKSASLWKGFNQKTC